MGMTIQITGEEEEINLTDFTVVKYNERLDSADGRNEYMSADLWGFEIFGEINPYDKSKELEEVNKLSLWAKKTAHEDDAYRKMTVTLFDTNNKEYDTIKFKNAFFMKYEESFEAEKGSIMFYAFLREFRQEEMVVKPIQKAAYGNIVAMPFSDNEISEEENLEFAGIATTGISNMPADAQKVILYRDNALAFENDAYTSESKRMLYSSKIVGGYWTFKRMYEEGFRKKGNDYHTYTARFDVYIDGKRTGNSLQGYTEGTVDFKEPYEHIYITECKEFMTRFGFIYTTNSPAKFDTELAESIYAFYHPDNPQKFIFFTKASYDGITLDAVKFSEVYTAIGKTSTINISYDGNFMLTIRSGKLPSVIGMSESHKISVLKICTDGSKLYTGNKANIGSPNYDEYHQDATSYSRVIPDSKAAAYNHLPNVQHVTEFDEEKQTYVKVWRYYPDPDKVNYFVIPGNYLKLSTQIRLGDVGVLIDHKTNKYVFCIVAETGPPNVFEEVSIFAAKNLGHNEVTPSISSNPSDYEFIDFLDSRKNITWTYDNLNQATIDAEGIKYYK